MKIRPILITLILACIIFTSQAMAQSSQRLKILGVAVKGNESISENSIKVQAGIMEGKEIIFDDIPDAIKKLWKLKIFSDIQIYMDKSTDMGLFLIIEVKEYPRLDKFEIKGNKKIRKSKFDEELNIISGKVLSPALISESKRKILDLYKEDGFLLAEVTEEITPGAVENLKNLTFHIKEGKKVRIKEVRFENNEQFSDSRLRRVLKETKQRNLWLLKIGEFKSDKYDEDKKLLVDFYNKEGYRDFEVVSDSIHYSEDNKYLYLNLEVYEGPRYKFRDITFSGNVLFTNEQLKQVLGIKSGDFYNKQDLQMAVYDRINGLYMDRGYLYFNIVPQEIPVGEDEIDLLLSITENHQVSVGRINIVGNDRTHENVIRRELKIYPGDIFSREALIRSQREIFIMNYFSDVVPDIVPYSDDEVDVEITVEEKSSDRANLSFSISQTYGLIGGGGIEFNNFRGRGQQLKVSYQQGTNYSIYGTQTNAYKSASISYTDPWLFDSPNLVGASLFYTERGYSSSYYYYPYDLTQRGGSLRWGRRFRWPDNYFRGTWMFAASKKEYFNLDEEYLQRVLLGQDKTTNVSLTQVISRDSRDAPEFPTKGSVLNWTATLAGWFLGGTEHFVKNLFSLDYYTPTIWKLVLYNHVELGIIQKTRENSIIPPDERFIMGGAGMVYGTALRGYDDNAISPVPNSATGSSYSYWGGESMFKYTLEYRVPISSNPTIYGLLFAEAGNTWMDLKTTDPFSLKRSAGFGVRFYMPALGMIGVDLGYGFDDIDPEGYTGYGKPEGWKTHFIFGMPF
ncbi:MAG: outer membrane protein assembly factor BamA [Candidatus Marinimicrobia bacterium]|nr:outer membrane protein assembly factor BamA [Candidatus Neomarinimicrobiota bacterium]